MKTYYPMATYDGQTDEFHTLTTYDSLWYPRDCLEVFEEWLKSYKIDRMWIQVYESGKKTEEEIPVVLSGVHPVLVKKWS